MVVRRTRTILQGGQSRISREMPATTLVSDVNGVALPCLGSPGDGCQVSSAKSRMHSSQRVAVALR